MPSESSPSMTLRPCCGALHLPRFVTIPLPFRITSSFCAPHRHITKVSLVSNGFASTVTLPSTLGPIHLLARLVTLLELQLVVRRDSVLFIGIAMGVG